MDKSRKNVLVTGCAGFIGSHATDIFLEKGHRVFGVDSMTYAADIENLRSAFSKTEDQFVFNKIDIREKEAILEICKKNNIEWIFNFAAETHVDNSITDVTPFIESNVVGVSALLDVCLNSSAKLFHISTDEVYGSVEEGSSLENDSFDPRNPYSATKAASEHLITSFSNTYGIEYLIVRPSNNFGPRQNYEKFLPTILKNISQGKKIPVYGDGENVRDWLFVKDNVRAIYDIWENSSTNEVYNISFCNEMKNIDLVRTVCTACKRDPEEVIEFVKDRKGHDRRYSVNPAKLRKVSTLLQTPFQDALSETMEFYLEKSEDK